MDFYLSEKNAYNRLVEEFQKYGKIIIAYDFDGTIFDFHGQGMTFDNVKTILRKFRNHAHFVCFTASDESRYDMIRRYTSEEDIPLDTINENIPESNIPKGKKVYYNILLDDRAGLAECYRMLRRLYDEHIKENNYETI